MFEKKGRKLLMESTHYYNMAHTTLEHTTLENTTLENITLSEISTDLVIREC